MYLNNRVGIASSDMWHSLGNTPLQPIRVVIHGRPRIIHLKLEGCNPTGSVKDRTAKGLVLALEKEGRLQKSSCLIESTSGNLGVALACLSQQRGNDFIAVVDPKTTTENIARMQAFGAEIELVTNPDKFGGYLLSRLERVRKLCQQSPRYVWSNQYGNQANPAIHKATTGPEIYRQMHSRLQAIFVAVSTGGTLAGIGEYLRNVSPATKIIAVDAHGSVIFNTPAAPRKLTGIGASQPSAFLRQEHYDEYTLVTDTQAFAFCRALAAQLDIYVGGSSGAVLWACVNYLARNPSIEHVVCLCPDDGKHYKDSIFNDHWLQANHLTITGEDLGPVESIEHVPVVIAA